MPKLMPDVRLLTVPLAPAQDIEQEVRRTASLTLAAASD